MRHFLNQILSREVIFGTRVELHSDTGLCPTSRVCEEDLVLPKEESTSRACFATIEAYHGYG